MKEPLTPQELAAWAGFVAAQGRVFRLVEDDLRRKAGLTHPEYEVLLRLSNAPERRERIQALAAKSLLSRSGVSRAIDRLARAGFLRREDAEEDGRGAYAVLTEMGLDHYKQARRQHLLLVKQAFVSRFSADELAQLTRFWERFRDLDTALVQR